jgi:hypothetical protein
MHSVIYCIIVILSVLFTSCNSSKQRELTEVGDTLQLKYARGVDVIRFQDYTIVDIKNPWKGEKLLQRYILYTRDKVQKIPSSLKGTKVSVPLKRCVMSTAAHCYLLEQLRQTSNIVAVLGRKYIHIPVIENEIKKGNIVDAGEEFQPNIEKLIVINPDALFLSPYEQAGSYQNLDKLGVPIIFCADYMESSSLARAEWMKVYSVFFDCEELAEILFDEVERNYKAQTIMAHQLHSKNEIFTERLMSSTWYCPGGTSTIAQLIKDANGIYSFSDNEKAGSIPLTFEQVFAKTQQAKVWAFTYNGEKDMTIGDLLKENDRYKALKVVVNGAIYACNASKVPFFEETPFRPDWLLHDFIIMLHPNHFQANQLKYYKKL